MFGSNNFDKDLINDISNLVNKHIEDDALPQGFIDAAKKAGEVYNASQVPEIANKELNSAMHAAATEHQVNLNNINMTKFQQIAKGSQ